MKSMRIIVGIVLALTMTALFVACCVPAFTTGRSQAREKARGYGEQHPQSTADATIGAPLPRPSAVLDRKNAEASLPGSPGEELWIVQRPESDATIAPPGKDIPGSGELRARLDDDKEIPLPLKHTDVKAGVLGYIATVDVTQQYHNPYGEKIEAVYVFPLPQDAAVNEFVMTIGERRIRGIIRKRAEAEQMYLAARDQGYVASLLTQERPNIFTQSVANIEPGKAIDINIRYFNTLAYKDGSYEFVFPMVVGPRFNPPGTSDGIGAVARGAHGTSGQSTEVQYLRPGERSGHDIALELDVDAGVKIEKISSLSHVIQVKHDEPSKAIVRLSPMDAIPNKDFVLRYRVAGDRLKSGLVTHADERGRFFTLMLFPPAELKDTRRQPLELVFVIDCSGSMNGEPIAQAKNAIKRALRRMQPDDTFQIIRFSNDASTFGRTPVPATPDNIRRATQYVDRLNGTGGTMMIEGIKAALDFPHDERRFRFVTLLTDGFIGNDGEILGEMSRRLGASRIFSFGVGSSPNRYLLERMARLGQGAVAYLSLNDSATQVMDTFFDRISHAALTDIEIDWGNANVADVYPSRIPDLFVGRPVTLTGRYTGEAPNQVRITGRAGGERQTVVVHGQDSDHDALAAVWARGKIAELMNRRVQEPSQSIDEQIQSVALEFNLMSAFTAFVAVDASERTAGDHGVTVAVPVPVPDGVRYDTTVNENPQPRPNPNNANRLETAATR